ncbi:MAG: secretin N-terminal domain-containing protein, partial [Thermoguttaceae bacterium]
MLFRRFLVLTFGVLLSLSITAHGQDKPASAGASPAAASPEALQEAVAAEPAQNADSHAAEEAKPTAVDPLATPQSQTPADAPKPDRLSTPPEAAPQPPAGEAPATASQENPADGAATGLAATPSTAPSTSQPPFKIQLYLIRTDWAQGKDVAGLDDELKVLLKDVTLPEPLQVDLLRAAPVALFPSKFMATYGPEEFAGIVAWMKRHDLLRTEDVEQAPLPDHFRVESPYHSERLFVPHNLSPGSPPSSQESPAPFVARDYVWEWLFRTYPESRDAVSVTVVEASRRPLRRDTRTVRGTTDQSIEPQGNPQLFRFVLPSDRVVAISCDQYRLGATPWWMDGAKAFRQNEWLPVLLLTPMGQEASEVAPRLTTPSSLLDITEIQQFSPLAPASTQQPAPGENDPSAVTVQLIRVCSDWSKGKDPEETKKALESLLEGASLPDEFRKDLLGSASRILFPEDFAAIYQPGQFADLLAWMTERDLVHIDARSEPLPDDSESRADPECRLFVSHDVVPLPINPRSKPAPPFVTRTYGWEWTCTSWLKSDDRGGQPNLQIDLFRAGLQLDEFQVDGEKSVTREPLSGDVKSVALPADRIAVIRHFDSRDAMSQRTREAGWEPFLVVRPVALREPQASDHPQPSRPSALVKLSHQRPERAATAPQREPSISTEAPALGSSHGPNLAPAAKADQQGSQVVVFDLEHAGLSQVIGALAAATPRVRAQVDDQRRSLIVVGPKDDLAVARDLIEALDQPAAPDQRQIKIFNLVHARAEQMAAILQQLFPEITMSGDQRTNSLIAQGEQPRLEAAEAVIQKLDETPSQNQESLLDEASRRRILETMPAEFASKESEARSVAESLAAEQDTAAAKELRMRLERLVTEAFDLRQKLQRAEAGLLRERIAVVETRLQQREVLRKEIIQRRVQALLSGLDRHRGSVAPASPSCCRSRPSGREPG